VPQRSQLAVIIFVHFLKASAVQNYLANGPSIPPASQFNNTGRAMSDVSSFSEDVIVFQDGSETNVGLCSML
jgi:hypothetical protein